MLRLIFITLILFYFPNLLQSQPLVVTPGTILMDTVVTGQSDTTWISIANLLNLAVEVTDLNVYDDAFTLTDTAFTIAIAGQKQVGIVFSPIHNVDYNTELVIVLNGLGGNISTDLRGTGKYPGSYYTSTQGLWEENLKTALKQLVVGHISLGYSSARDKMFMNIDNKKVNGQGASQNTLEGVYTGQIITGYTDRQDAQNNYNFNTEHTFPQSTFGSAEPMLSDLYHLFPTLGTANSERGNKPFRPVSNPTWQSGGSKSNGSYFEPRAQQKGPTSRAMLYFLIRYQNYNSYVSATDQDILKSWNKTYIPSAIEQKRNEDIASLQHNRNPFIDHPLLADRITNFIGTSVRPVVKKMAITSDTIRFGTIQSGLNASFNLVLVSTGNQPVEINYLGFSEQSLAVINADTNISPGESGIVKIGLTPSDTGSFSGQLFMLTTAHPDTVKIPITAHVIPPTGLDQSPVEKLHIFPNPGNGILQILNPLDDSIQVMVIDDKGLPIAIPTLAKGMNRLDLSHLSPGIYLILWQEAVIGRIVII